MSGIERIAAEREEQKTQQWSDAHDDRHYRGELAMAAVCYAMPPQHREEVPVRSGDLGEGWVSCSRAEAEAYVPEHWPWDPTSWKPSGSVRNDLRIHELAKAGALIAAEIDRLERRRVLP